MPRNTHSRKYPASLRVYDVIVVGGGNAALCAALSARQHVGRVLVLERAPIHMRGGNTRHTRNIRCAQGENGDSRDGYSETEFLEDLKSVTGTLANESLARFTIKASRTLPAFMEKHGVSWQPPLAGTLSLGRTNKWFLGGGKALLNTYYEAASKMGIEVRYCESVENISIAYDRFSAVYVQGARGNEVINGRAVVVAAGGFEANIEWLKRYWGDAAENFRVRGTPYNDGKVLALLLDKGAAAIGDPKSFHAIAVDARAPKFDGGIVTRLDSIPFGIVVNSAGRRFYDEGENIWPKRYAIWGRLIAEQPDQIAYCIVDRRTIQNFLPPIYKPFEADSIGSLALRLTIDPVSLTDTVNSYNRATLGNTSIQPNHLDGVKTSGLDVPKSNWALPLTCPPFYGLPLRPGITFTYMGVAVDEFSRVLRNDGTPFENVYAAGEVMSGNILTKGYLAGFGLTIGSVFGRLAGQEAGRNAHGQSNRRS
jgi:tricarballylate dehydrogenase